MGRDLNNRKPRERERQRHDASLSLKDKRVRPDPSDRRGQAMSEGRNPQRRPVRRKRRNPKRARRFFLFCLFTFVAVTALTLSLTVLFPVKNIVIEGNSKYGEEEIKSVSGIMLEENLFRTDIDSAKQKILNNFPYAYDVAVERRLPNTIYISIAETEPVAVIWMGSDDYYLDIYGRVCEKVPNDDIKVKAAIKELDPKEEEPQNGEEMIAAANLEVEGEVEDGAEGEAEGGTEGEAEGEVEGEAEGEAEGGAEGMEYYEPEKTKELESQRTKLPRLLLTTTSEVILGQSIFEEDRSRAKAFVALTAELIKAGLYEGITEMDFRSVYNIKLNYEGRILITIGQPTDLEYKLETMQKIIKDELSETVKGKLNVTNPDRAPWEPIQE